MHKPPENRLNSAYAQTIIRALRHIERDLVKPGQPGKLGLMHEASHHEAGTPLLPPELIQCLPTQLLMDTN